MWSFGRLGVACLILLQGSGLLACDSGVDAARDAIDAGTEMPSAGVSGTSEQGLYVVRLWPREGEIVLQRLQEWVIRIRSASGEAVRPTRVAIDGGMPQHKHGLVTQPRVTGSLPNGDLLIEGMKFHMGGKWTLRVEIAGREGADVAILQVQVGP